MEAEEREENGNRTKYTHTLVSDYLHIASNSRIIIEKELFSLRIMLCSFPQAHSRELPLQYSEADRKT